MIKLVAIRALMSSCFRKKPIGKILLGTVKGDLHDIGKNLVKMMAQGAGIDVVDLGIDVSPDKFLQAFKDNPDAKAIGMSAFLTTTMIAMRDVIQKFETDGARKKFMVGGTPLTDQFAREIGAEGYAPDEASAADKFKAFPEVIKPYGLKDSPRPNGSSMP